MPILLGKLLFNTLFVNWQTYWSFFTDPVNFPANKQNFRQNPEWGGGRPPYTPSIYATVHYSSVPRRDFIETVYVIYDEDMAFETFEW